MEVDMILEQTPDSERNMINGVKIENYQALMEYQRRSMEGRRSMELKFFTGAVVVNLLLLKESLVHISILQNHSNLFCTVIALFFTIFIVFFGVSIQMQYVNWKVRQKYHDLERTIYNHMKGLENQGELEEEGFFKAIGRSWSFTWTSGGLLILSCISSYLIYVAATN
jgi:hypothetical protein